MADAFPRNLIEFSDRFASDEACVEYLAGLRWPGGFVCPRCGHVTGWPTARGTIFCQGCRRQTSVTAGTIFHKTHLPLRCWFLAMWLACTQKTGLSAKGLQRELGLGSYRSAWLMLQKLRQAMVRAGRDRLQGSVELDETYIGGEETGVIGRRLVGKALVVIAVELDGRKIGRVRLRHVPDGSAGSLLPFVAEAVEPGAQIHTDGWVGYSRLAHAGGGYRHRVTHVRGDHELALGAFPRVHLVASLLKRWLGATHQGRVSHKHLQRYLDEFSFRFNRRRSRHVGQLFHRLAEQLVLRQALTYTEITAD
jgi:transposase-like protein